MSLERDSVDIRWLFSDQDFDCLIEHLFKCRIQDNEFCKKLYSSLTNTLWTNGEESASYTFRTAAGFIADMRGRGETYMDFYCCGMPGLVGDEIEEKLNAAGWSATE